MSVKLTINGNEYEVEEGQTLLEVSKAHDIEIPTLCHHKALPAYGACRLCLVELVEGESSQLVSSCTYPVMDGLQVVTESEKVDRNRKMMIELLLSRSPEEEALIDLAEKYGVGTLRFSERDDNCILCGLCVRMCERMGIQAINFTGRGTERELGVPYLETSPVCMTCGACAYICPTTRFTQEKVERISGNAPLPLLSEFNAGIASRPAIYIPFPQAVPKVPVIDKEKCVYYQSGSCKTCSEFCEPGAIIYDQEDDVLDRDVGAIVVATGFDLFDPKLKPQYGYGESPHVLTGLEFERYVSASGPTMGHIEINGKEPKRVVFIHCVGSRDKETHEYCSRVCCMYTAKHAHMVVDKLPGSEVSVYYTDVRAFGKGFEEFYNRVQDEGVDYRFRELDDDIKVIPNENGVTVKAAGHPDIEADLLVLATAIEPRDDLHKIRNLLKVSSSQDGFLLEAHPKLRPIDTHTDGIYLAGCCQAPRDVPDTVAQASGAASRVTSILSKEVLKIAAIVSEVDQAVCRGCGFCVEVCPYGAVELVALDRHGREVFVSQVNEAQCKGCGTCVASCLSGAIQQRGFSDAQLLDAVDGIVGG